MKFSLASLFVAAAALGSVSAAPQPRSLQLHARAPTPQITCPADIFTSGAQSYRTVCQNKWDPTYSTAIEGPEQAKNFVDCLAKCSAKSASGTYCDAVTFQREGKQCTLYSFVVNSDFTGPGFALAKVTNPPSSCST